MNNHLKGQITIVNLLQLVVSFIIAIMLLPLIQGLVDQTIVTLELTPNQYTPFVVMALNMIGFVLILSIAFSAIGTAIPQNRVY